MYSFKFTSGYVIIFGSPSSHGEERAHPPRDGRDCPRGIKTQDRRQGRGWWSSTRALAIDASRKGQEETQEALKFVGVRRKREGQLGVAFVRTTPARGLSVREGPIKTS